MEAARVAGMVAAARVAVVRAAVRAGARVAAETAAVGTVGLYLDFEGSDDAHAWWRHHQA